jgi:hypothetical protein
MANGSTVPDQNQGERRAGFVPRDRLARLVVLGSFLTIFLLVAGLLAVAQLGTPEATQLAEKTFNTILPVLAGWVGSVMAFYFSAQSNERTSQSLDRAISQAAGAPAPTKPVTEVMIPFASVREVRKVDEGKEGEVSLKSPGLQDLIDPKRDGGPITRIMIVNSQNIFRYLIHIGTLNSFLMKEADRTPLTLADLVGSSEYLLEVSKLVVFVPATATIAEAKAKLDAVPRAQDVIVTANGRPSEPVLGWITNIDLMKTLSAA